MRAHRLTPYTHIHTIHIRSHTWESVRFFSSASVATHMRAHRHTPYTHIHTIHIRSHTWESVRFFSSASAACNIWKWAWKFTGLRFVEVVAAR